jgi:hypothetical protein
MEAIMGENIPPAQLKQLIECVRAEYLKLPTLNLTLKQARRLWGLDPERCRAVFDLLVRSGFLEVTSEGRFVHVVNEPTLPESLADRSPPMPRGSGRRELVQ